MLSCTSLCDASTISASAGGRTLNITPSTIRSTRKHTLSPTSGTARLAVALAIAFLGLLLALDVWSAHDTATGRILWTFVLLCGGGLAAFLWLRSAATIDAVSGVDDGPDAVRTAGRLETGLAVVALAGAGLFFELSLIRWHASLFPMFAFYKNFSLLACFAGLGLGYATAASERSPLLLSLALLAFQVVLLTVVRYGSGDALTLLMTSPIAEQTTMGSLEIDTQMGVAAYGVIFVIVYGLLATVFLTTLVMFMPIGQLTGRCMQRLPRLDAYGLNLLGSILGVGLFMAASYLWLPPVAWFAVIGAALLVFQSPDRRRWVASATMFVLMILAVAWPGQPTHHQLYSPYQLIERTAVPESGLMEILAAGTYYQRVFDFSAEGSGRHDPDYSVELAYYELPYRLANSLDQVAIVGAGTGNDVAAALRAGAGAVDAVEIDPVIVALGRDYHPERPYHDPRVEVIVEDARTFFRTTARSYDAIVYAVLDSHTQLAQGSSVRIDSFVYTREAFEESYARLEEGGMLCVSFALLSEAQGPRIFEMMRQAAGHAPIAVRVGYDRESTSAFLLVKGGDPEALRERVEAAGFVVASDEFAAFDPGLDIPTDDWPFFYMKQRSYPVSYLPAIVLMLALTVFAGRHVLFQKGPRLASLGFFLLGAGFMLIETKAITQLGLAFGSTWMVVAIAVVAILAMAFLANLWVTLARPRRSALYHILLLASIAVAYLVYGTTLFDDWNVERLLSVVILTFPVLFSGIVFSTELSETEIGVAQALGFNILGALFGGLAEYNSMYFGYSFLFVLAALFYAGAMIAFGRRSWT